MGSQQRQPPPHEVVPAGHAGAADGGGDVRVGRKVRHSGRMPAVVSWVWPVALALSVAAGSLASLLLPAAVSRSVDQALSSGSGSGSGGGGGGGGGVLQLAVVVGVLTAAEAAAQYAGPRATAQATARLRSTVLRRVLAAGPYPAHRTAVGDLVARLTAGAAEAGLAGQAIIYTVAQLGMAAAAVVALGLLAPELAAAFLLTAPAGWLLLRRHVRRTVQRGTGYQRAQADVAARLMDALAGSRTIAAAGTVEQEIERVLRPVPELSRHGYGLWDSQRRVAFSTGLLAPATQIAVLAAAGHCLSRGTVSTGELVAALGYTALALGGFGAAQSLLDLARARAGQARIAQVLDTGVAPVGLRALPAGPGRVELHGITVRRQGRVVLDRLDLVLPAGTLTAVVGASGAGTSLLAAAAGGLLTPEQGLVVIDGVPIEEVRPTDLRTAVSYAFTDPALTGTTILDALTAAAQPISPARARRAARTAQADAFIRRLPAGYDTPLADAPLSGGQRQRLGLARALAPDCRLLVLDDATSSLDTATEARLLAAMNASHRGRTRLVVTRRTSLAAQADAVAWLEDGRIRALAPHQRLWRIPAYRRIFTGTPTEP